jgi:hypothetical protein
LARKPTDFIPFKLRIREALRRRLEREAEKKKISTNAEAVERLEWSFFREYEDSRDTKIVDLLTGPSGPSSNLLRYTFEELRDHPDWNENKDTIDDLVNRFADHARSVAASFEDQTSHITPDEEDEK